MLRRIFELRVYILNLAIFEGEFLTKGIQNKKGCFLYLSVTFLKLVHQARLLHNQDADLLIGLVLSQAHDQSEPTVQPYNLVF